MTNLSVDLSKYSNSDFNRGRGTLVEVLWKMVSKLVIECPFNPFYGFKRMVLRCFGAEIGVGVLIKPRVRITFPWKLKLGDHAWVGEEVWIDNLVGVEVGAHACISQRAYICTGNHDYKKQTFDLCAEPIHIGAGSWIAAGAIVGPGVKVGENTVLGLGAVAIKDLAANGIYMGNPAVKVAER